jgi:hypothetical protein
MTEVVTEAKSEKSEQRKALYRRLYTATWEAALCFRTARGDLHGYMENGSASHDLAEYMCARGEEATNHLLDALEEFASLADDRDISDDAWHKRKERRYQRGGFEPRFADEDEEEPGHD